MFGLNRETGGRIVGGNRPICLGYPDLQIRSCVVYKPLLICINQTGRDAASPATASYCAVRAQNSALALSEMSNSAAAQASAGLVPVPWTVMIYAAADTTSGPLYPAGYQQH